MHAGINEFARFNSTWSVVAISAFYLTAPGARSVHVYKCQRLVNFTRNLVASTGPTSRHALDLGLVITPGGCSQAHVAAAVGTAHVACAYCEDIESTGVSRRSPFCHEPRPLSAHLCKSLAKLQLEHVTRRCRTILPAKEVPVHS